METIIRTIHGQVPSKSNGYVVGLKGIYKSKKVKEYERLFSIQYARHEKIETEFAIHCDVYFKTKASDLDGMWKITLDCLQKNGAISNDRNCIALSAKKFVDIKDPRIEIRINKI